jgi:hypothetical protein
LWTTWTTNKDLAGPAAPADGGRDPFFFDMSAFSTAAAAELGRRTGGDHFNKTDEQPEKRYAGEFVDLDSKKITVECKTADGTAGAITVDGKPFDLTEGWLILASPGARGFLWSGRGLW